MQAYISYTPPYTYQELFGHSRIFLITYEEFYGIVDFDVRAVKRFVEVPADLALDENCLSLQRGRR